MTRFGPATLGAFADAAASIPLRALDRAFARAGVALGEDASDAGGARRVRFRGYVASVDQTDASQRDRLGDALGALVAEVATAKVDYLVAAAARDGFRFVDGAFRAADTSRAAFAVASLAEFATIDERARRLRVLADDRPPDAVAGATSLFESVCRIVLGAADARARTDAGLVDLATATLESLDARAIGRAIARLGDLVALDSPRAGDADARYARLAVDAAVAFVTFVAATYAMRTAEGTMPAREPGSSSS